ncbi:MAG: PHP domain-containing protein [Euryarchaeota archaeon]|nr:PHP domain-containing protein [Euryarchaeota archaeon]
MRADLHIHSDHSGDGRQSLDDIVRRCRALGLRAISITDHNNMDCYPFKLDDIIILPGMEITSSDGHILAYMINEPIPRGRDTSETIDLIHDQGGIAVAAHPYRWWSGLGEVNVKEHKFDAIEILNSRSSGRGNRRAKKLASKVKLPGIGGSDAHVNEHVGCAVTVFSDDCQNAEDLIYEIKRGKISTEGRSRGFDETLAYGTRSIFKWILRGFRRL